MTTSTSLVVSYDLKIHGDRINKYSKRMSSNDKYRYMYEGIRCKLVAKEPLIGNYNYLFVFNKI